MSDSWKIYYARVHILVDGVRSQNFQELEYSWVLQIHKIWASNSIWKLVNVHTLKILNSPSKKYILIFIWKICIIWYHLYHLRAIIKKLEFSVFWLCILKLFCWFLFRFVEMVADGWRLICDNRLHLKDLSSYIICIIHVRSSKVEVFFKCFFYVFSFFLSTQKSLKGHPVSRV